MEKSVTVHTYISTMGILVFAGVGARKSAEPSIGSQDCGASAYVASGGLAVNSTNNS